MTPAFTMRPVFEHCGPDDPEPGAVRFDVTGVAPGGTSSEPGDAAVALTHPQAYTKPNPRQVRGELRELTFAPGLDGRLLAVVHTQRGDNVRIISTRRANRRERKRYAEATGTPAR